MVVATAEVVWSSLAGLVVVLVSTLMVTVAAPLLAGIPLFEACTIIG